jgi:zinc transporter 1/2/3
MLPEVYEGWQKYTKVNEIDINLALGIVVICGGFFLVYFVEELAHLMADRHAHNKEDVSIHRAVSIRGCPVSLEGPAPPCEPSSCHKSDGDASCQDSTICQLDCNDKEFCRDVTEGEECSSSKCYSSIATCSVIHNFEPADGYGTFGPADSQKIPDTHQQLQENKHLVNRNPHNGNSQRYLTVLFSFHTNEIKNCYGSSIQKHWTKETNTGSMQRSQSGGNHSHDLHHHHGLMMENGHCVGAPLRGLLFIVALSLHEILEGIAVGLQKNQSGVLQLFAAVASHKFVISFCVGLELSTSGVKFLMHTIYILVFSLVTPLGK